MFNNSVNYNPGFFLGYNATNFFSGAVAGSVTGTCIGPMEALKVKFQTQGPPPIKDYISISLYRQLMKMTPPLIYCFGATCALEFSVNENVRDKFGPWAGITSSALTGATLLTASDHLMFLSVNGGNLKKSMRFFYKIGYSKLFTGLSAMCLREAWFVAGVMYLGPALGEKLHAYSGEEKNLSNEIKWNAAGTMSAGFVTTFFSQPCDSLAREMQKQVEINPAASPRLFSTFKNCSVKQLFRGAVPRLGLSTVGGALAGTLFKLVKENIWSEQKNNSEPAANPVRLER